MDPEDVPLELGGLAEALTCPICKELFDGPVSPPCGHTFCSMCIRQSLDFAHANKQKGTCPSCRADCNPDQLRRVDALRVVSTALPVAALAVHDLKRRLEESERRIRLAEQQLAVAHGHSGAAATAARGAAVAAACSRGTSLKEPAEGLTGAVASYASGRPRRGPSQQQASQPPDRSTRQAQGSRSCKRRAVGRTDARRGGDGEDADEDGQEDDASDFEAVTGRGDRSDDDPGFELASEEEDDEDARSDGDDDYTPSGRNKGRQQSRAAAGASQAAGSRKRGRPSSAATAATTAATAAAATAAAHQPHHGAAGARASGSAPPQMSAPAHEPAPQDGMGDCPLCGRRYSLAQLQSHVDICLTRQSARAGGAAGPSGAAALSMRGPSPGPAAVAGAAKAGPLVRTFAAGAGTGAGAAAVVAGGRSRPGSAGGAGGGGGSSGGPAAPSRPPTDVKVPPAQVWHSMTDKAARKVMSSYGLPITGDKNDWSARYNRYRTFLRTEKDRCTTLTMDQLLRAFLQKEQQEDAGRRQPAAAPNWMLNQIREAAERMKAAQRSQQAEAAHRARSASAAGLHDDGGGNGADGAAAAASPAADPGGGAMTEAAPGALTEESPQSLLASDDQDAAAARLEVAAATVAPATSAAAPPPAAAAAVPGLSNYGDRDIIMIGSDSEEDADQGAATVVPTQAAAGPGSWLGPNAATPGNGGPEPGAHEPRRLAPAGEADMPGGDAVAGSDAATASGADVAGAFGGDGVLRELLPALGQGPELEVPHSKLPVGQHDGGPQQPLEPEGQQPSEQQGQGHEQSRDWEQEQLEEADAALPAPRSSQWMRAGSPPPGADEDEPSAHLPVASGSWGLPWALDYGGRSTAGGGWLADISNGTGSQRQARPSLQLAGEAAMPGGKALAAAAAWNAQRGDALGVAVPEQQQE